MTEPAAAPATPPAAPATPPAAAPATPAQAPARAAPALDVPTEVARVRAELDADKAALLAEKATVAGEVAKVRAEADQRILRVEAGAAFRAMGLDQARITAALKLMGDELTVVGGEVVSRADPKVPLGDVIKTWLDGPGSFLRPPTVPAGGAGAPAAPAAPAAAPPLDLATEAGATGFAMGLLSGGVAALRKTSP